MTQEEIIEGNNTIKTFINDAEPMYDNNNFIYAWRKGKYIMNYTELNYHSSWDWLMPVVNKIRSLYNEAIIMHSDIIDDLAEGCVEGNIYQAYEAVVEFITWFNTQNKK